MKLKMRKEKFKSQGVKKERKPKNPGNKISKNVQIKKMKKNLKSERSILKKEENEEDKTVVSDVDKKEESYSASGVLENKNIPPASEVENPSASTESENSTMNVKGKRKQEKGKVVQRSEASLNISEFHLNEVGKEKVKLAELIKTSKKLSGQDLLKKQLNKAKMLKTLSVPLSKPQMEKIKRSIAYEKVCDEVTKWEPVVKSNRAAVQIIFPLKKPEIGLKSFEEVSENFVTKHPVQEAVSKLLKTSNNVLERNKLLTAAEEKALKAMSLEEAKLRHNELMKQRALISYREAKARRQNKIKSKRYHRILKREKLKKMIKEFEELQKTDAAAALEKLLEADKLRILERMTLKHRNTGKWAKQQKLRAKYNPDSRSCLKEDVAIGRQLREKLAVDETVSQLKTKVSCTQEEEPNEISSHSLGLIEDVDRKNSASDIDMLISNEQEESYVMSGLFEDLEKGTASSEPLLTPSMQSVQEENISTVKTNLKVKQPPAKPKQKKTVTVEDEIAFSSEVTCLNSMVPNDITFGDEDLDDTNDDKITINQAFADDELIAEFQEEKQAAENAHKSDSIDLFLPGWGSWGGPGIKPSKRKRKRFLIKPLDSAPKKSSLSNVIINEEKDKKAAAHQVSHLPFPFTNIHQFESYIRQPIGDTWNPQSSFQNLIAPKVITKMGKIIEPIDPEDDLLKKKQDHKVKKMKGEKKVTAF